MRKRCTRWRTAAAKPFLAKSLKLGHADVGKALDDVYAAMPMFSEEGPEGVSPPTTGDAVMVTGKCDPSRR